VAGLDLVIRRLTVDKQTYDEKLAKAKEYLRSRDKYVLDPGCPFVPTGYTTPVKIVEKYGKEPRERAD
jgi:hypothetical protein